MAGSVLSALRGTRRRGPRWRRIARAQSVQSIAVGRIESLESRLVLSAVPHFAVSLAEGSPSGMGAIAPDVVPVTTGSDNPVSNGGTGDTVGGDPVIP